jgi:cytoskeletal protein CcmA (bactofilin family)
MGLFFAPKTAAGPAVATVDRRRPAQGGLSIVAKDLTIAGDLQAAGVIRIEGRVIGNVHAGDQVLISEGGIVEGDVAAREAVVGGRVHGCIQGEERVELQSSAIVHGDIVTRRLLIQEGGRVNGTMTMEGLNGAEPHVGDAP